MQNFNPDDFEEFLREQVRNHRMYPGDVVWRDINKTLHGDKKWPALTIAACILLSATIFISVYFTPKPDLFTTNPAYIEQKNSTLSNSQHNIALNNLVSPSEHKLPMAEAVKKQVTATITASSAGSDNKSSKVTVESRAVFARENLKKQPTIAIAGKQDRSKNYSLPPTINASGNTTVNKENLNTVSSSKQAPAEIKFIAKTPKIAGEFTDRNIVDKFLKDHKDDISLHTSGKQKRFKNKFSYQVYIAPSVSYRKLLEDHSMLKESTSAGPVGLNYVADVNKVVRHKPGNGLEAGVSILYNVSGSFRVKSGLQFNVRQYSIEAYRSSTELSSIALIGNNRIDTVSTLTFYRNNNGYYPAELVNRYYQLSIPVGIEWEIVGNKRIQLNVAGTIQPTYLLNSNAYLLSTNFKNYSENPDMVRSFNINSNIETYISFKAGKYKWQIGPQLRYQPYSTFIPQYPIKEHLLDYGVKFGFSKTFH